MEEMFLAQFPPIFFRALGIFALLPMGNALNSLMLKTTFAAGLAALAVGSVPVSAHYGPLALVTEFFLGAIIVLPTALIVNMATMAGEILDTARGEGVAEAYDPMSDVQAKYLGMLLQHLTWASLCLMGVLEVLVGSFWNSFNLLKAGAFEVTLPSIIGLGTRLLVLVESMMGALLVALLPFVLTLFLVDLMFGFIGRAIPSLHLDYEPFILRSAIVFGLLLALFKLEPWHILMAVVASPLFGAP